MWSWAGGFPHQRFQHKTSGIIYEFVFGAKKVVKEQAALLYSLYRRRGLFKTVSSLYVGVIFNFFMLGKHLMLSLN